MAICSIIPAPCASASRPSAGLFHAGRLAARHRRPSLSLGRRPSRPHRSAAVLPSHLRARHKRSQDAPFPGRPHPWVEGVLDARRGLGAVGDGDHRRRRLEPRGGPSPGGLAPVVSEQVVAVEHQIGKRLPGPGPAVQIVLDLRVVVDVVEAGFPGAGVGQGVVPDDHPRRLDEAGLDGVVQAEVAETPGLELLRVVPVPEQAPGDGGGAGPAGFAPRLDPRADGVDQGDFDEGAGVIEGAGVLGGDDVSGGAAARREVEAARRAIETPVVRLLLVGEGVPSLPSPRPALMDRRRQGSGGTGVRLLPGTPESCGNSSLAKDGPPCALLPGVFETRGSVSQSPRKAVRRYPDFGIAPGSTRGAYVFELPGTPVRGLPGHRRTRLRAPGRPPGRARRNVPRSGKARSTSP